MRSYVLFLCLFLVFLSTNVLAQSYSISAKVGVASFTASDLSLLQDEIVSENILPLKKLESFPTQPSLQLSLLRKDKEGNLFGLFWGFTSTGGRVNVRDHTASVTSDQILTNHELGFELEVLLEENRYFRPYIDVQLSALISSIELIDEIKTSGGQSSQNELKLVAQNVGIQPSIGFRFDQLSVPVKMEFGYLIQVTQFPFHLRENRDATLRTSNDIEVGPGLSGIRAGISVEYWF